MDTFILEHFSKYAKDYEDELGNFILEHSSVIEMDALEEDYAELIDEELWPDYDEYGDEELEFNAHILRKMSTNIV